MTPGSILVVADYGDAGAAAVADATAARLTNGRVEQMNPAELSLATWTHRIAPSGAVTTIVELRDGRRFDSEQLGAVLVRSVAVPAPRFAASRPADRDYAAAELQALVVSWLASLGRRVVNRGDGVSISGPSWTPRRWLVEAGRAGLPICAATVATSARLVTGWRGSPYEARLPLDSMTSVVPHDPLETAVVVGERVLGGERRHRAACLRLAATAGCRLLGLDFVRRSSGLELRGVSVPARLASPKTEDAATVEAVADLLAHMANGGAP